MRKLVRFPALSIVLAVTWLAMTELSAAHVALALVLAAAIPAAVSAFLEGLPRVRAPLLALRLLAHVAWDILVANVAVARLVIGPLPRLRPVFIEVPLALTDRQAVALLATIVTMTPGTVSVALAPDARVLRVHALDVADPAQVVANIKARYETPLKEILEC